MTVADPQSTDWGGLAWSTWHDFDRARDERLIPATPGLYRFRVVREKSGLLYVGESGAAGGAGHASTIWHAGAAAIRPISISTGVRTASRSVRTVATMRRRISASARMRGARSRSRGFWANTLTRRTVGGKRLG